MSLYSLTWGALMILLGIVALCALVAHGWPHLTLTP